MLQRGFTLIEILIAASLTVVIALASSHFLMSQNNTLKVLYQRNEVQNLQNILRQSLQSSRYCGCLFQGATLDSTATPPVLTAPLVQMPTGFDSVCTPSASNIVAVGVALPNTTMNVLNLGVVGVDALSPPTYRARFEVSFDSTTTVIALRPIGADVVFSVDPTDPANAQRMVSCGTGNDSPVINPFVSVGAPAVNIPANRCPFAIRVEMQMDAFRGNRPNGGYMGRSFQIAVDGATSPNYRLEFGSEKLGSSGHGWHYQARGLSKTFYITDVQNPHTLTSSLAGDASITIDNANFSVICE